MGIFAKRLFLRVVIQDLREISRGLLIIWKIRVKRDILERKEKKEIEVKCYKEFN